MSRYIAPCDSNLYYVVCHFYYFAITSSYNAQISLTINDLTHLEAIFIALLHPKPLNPIPTYGLNKILQVSCHVASNKNCYLNMYDLLVQRK